MSSVVQITILEGATFCVSDELGDIVDPTTGFFAADTRFLSRFLLTIDGARPLLLSYGQVEYFSAAWFLRNPTVGGLAHDSVSIQRSRFIGDGMQEHVVCVNHLDRRVEFELGLDLGSDFADIFTVKAFDSSLGDPESARVPEVVPAFFDEEENGFVFSALGDFDGSTRSACHAAARSDGRHGSLPGRARAARAVAAPRRRARRPGRRRHRAAHGRAPLRRRAHARPGVAGRVAARVPQLRSSWDDLGRDVLALGLRPRLASDARRRLSTASSPRPACRGSWPSSAGTRSSRACRRCSSAPSSRAERAAHARRAAGRRRTTRTIDAEPGKIVHEVRNGRGADAWFPALLRHARRHAALPRAPLRGLALDGRRGARPQTSRRRRSGARVDRALRRPRRRRLRRVPAALGEGPRRTSPGRTPASRRSSPTGGSPSRRSRRSRCRATSTTRSSAWRSWPARSGATASSPSGSSARPPSCSGASTRRSGSRARRLLRARPRRRQAAGRLALLEHRPSAVERDRPARAGRRRRRPAHGRGARGPAGACGRCPPTTPASTRSSTTTARSGRTTTR